MRRIAWVLLMTAAMALPAAAEETSGFPRLGEHVFVPVTALPEPFLVTIVQTVIGMGQTVGATSPLFTLQDSTVIGEVESDQALADIGFLYQQGVKDWLAVSVRLGIIGRLGTDTSSLLSDGITGGLGYELGWLMRMYRSRTVLLSGSIGLGTRNATFINIRDWAYGQISGTNVELVRGRTSLAGSGGLRVGWGINRRFGLLGSLTASYGESVDGLGENDWYSDLRVALSYDIMQDLDVPLGLALTGGRTENDVAGDSSAEAWFWTARFAIQGRTDYTVGLQVGNSYFDSSSQDDQLQFFRFTIDTRYYY